VLVIRRRKRRTTSIRSKEFEKGSPIRSAESTADGKVNGGSVASTGRGPEEAITEGATRCIKGQIEIAMSFLNEAGKTRSDFYELLGTPYVLGYLFGVNDAFIQRYGVRDQAEAISLMAVIYGRCFGFEAGAEMLPQSLKMQVDSVFLNGRVAGGRDVYEFLQERKVPLGLANHLMQASGFEVDLAATVPNRQPAG
jgi:hypothetical protein